MRAEDSIHQENADGEPRKKLGLLTILVALALLLITAVGLGIWHEDLIGFARINYLYHLGHQKQWSKAAEYLESVPLSSRGSPRYACVKMDILLRLSQTARALEYAQSKPLAHLPPAHRGRIAFEQITAFAFLLDAKDSKAAAILRQHRGDALSTRLLALLEGAAAREMGLSADADSIPALIGQRMSFPTLYTLVVQCLPARNPDSREQARSIELLENACSSYPYFLRFQMELGRAYLAQGRYDRATLHFVIASLQLQDRRLHAFAQEDLAALQKIVLEDVLQRSQTREPADFWRLLRGIRKVLPDALVVPRLQVNPHKRSLAELWEWSRLFKEYRGSDWERYADSHADPLERRILNLLEKVTATPPRRDAEFFLADRDSSPTALLDLSVLSVTPISLNEKQVFNDSIPVDFTLVCPPENQVDAIVLFRVRTTLRQGVGGGCAVQLGQDSHWISPDPVAQWYAIPAPRFLPGEMRLRIRLDHDYVPGYTDSDVKGDRNLYVSEVLLCRLR
jgi:tetratricopeptide (TPR) repeat protein